MDLFDSAMIGVVVTVFIAVVGAVWQMARRIGQIEGHIAQNRFKIDTLWDIYGVDAIREARMSGLTERHSRESPTRKWDESLPGALRDRIAAEIEQRRSLEHSDRCVQVMSVLIEDLKSAARETGLSLSSLFGVIQVLCDPSEED